MASLDGGLKMSRMTSKKINIRIISVLFAMALWLYVASEQNPMEYRNIKDVPVRLLNTESVNASGLVVKDSQDYKTDVTLQGKRSVLAEIKAGEIIAHADLRGYTQKGVNNVPVEVRGLPTNIELVDFNPKIIKVSMEPILSAQVPVTVSIEGRPLEGYTELAPIVSPGEVLVNGPESLLGSIRVVTAVIKLSGATGDLHDVLAVRAIDADNNDVAGVVVNPNIVDVTVPVRKTKEVAIEVVFEGRPAAGRDVTGVTQSRDTIVIYGEESLLQTVNSVRTQPVSLTGIDEDASFDVGIAMPEGIAAVGNVNAITVYVSVEKITTREFSIQQIDFTGMDNNLKLSEETDLPVVRVVVEGRESIVDKISSRDISVTAVMDGLTEGSHTVALKADLPEGIQLVSMEPEQIELELVTISE